MLGSDVENGELPDDMELLGKTIEDIKRNVVEQEPVAVNEVDFTIPEDLAKIVHRMMRKDINKRYRQIKNVLFALKKNLI